MTFLILCLFGLGGILIHVILKFRDDVTKVPATGITLKERFQMVWTDFDILGTIIYAVFAMLLVVLFVALREKLLTLGFPVTEVTIIGVGYMADSALKNLMPEKK